MQVYSSESASLVCLPMDATSLETVSRWAGAAAVVLSVLAAIAISIATYASSRLAAGASVRTEIAPVHELKSNDQPAAPEAVTTTGTDAEPAPPPLVTPAIASTITRSSEPSRDRQAAVAMLRTALSPPQVELTWAADPDSYPRAKEIEEALAEAGWTVTPAGSVLLASEPTATSLTAGVLSDETMLLRKALETAGLKVTMLFDPAMPPDRVRLTIGNDQ
jgi:hypothetical protein